MKHIVTQAKCPQLRKCTTLREQTELHKFFLPFLKICPELVQKVQKYELRSSENLADTLFRIQYTILLKNQKSTNSTLNNSGLKIRFYLTGNKSFCCCCVLFADVTTTAFSGAIQKLTFWKAIISTMMVQNGHDTWRMWFVESVFSTPVWLHLTF